MASPISTNSKWPLTTVEPSGLVSILANDRQIASVQKAWRSVGRIGSVETLIGIVRTRSGLVVPQRRPGPVALARLNRPAGGRFIQDAAPWAAVDCGQIPGEFGPIWHAQSHLPAWMPVIRSIRSARPKSRWRPKYCGKKSGSARTRDLRTCSSKSRPSPTSSGWKPAAAAAAAGRRHPVRLQDRRDACRDGRSRFEARDAVAASIRPRPILTASRRSRSRRCSRSATSSRPTRTGGVR